MDRRGFLRKTVGAAVMAPFLPWYVAEGAIARIGKREPGTIRTRQTIADIIIGCGDDPADVASLFTFYRRSMPNLPLLAFALNQRATFRWVAAPDMELVIPAGDVLEWKIESSRQPAPQWTITTMGHEVDTGRLVINQAYYGNEIEAA